MYATSDANDNGTDDQLTCPVPSCTYSNESPQGIAAHVGSAHPRGWDDADATPRDVHQAATVRDESDSRRAAKVSVYLCRNGVESDAVRVYVHGGYGTVQIVVEDYLGDDWPAFKRATDVDGIQYVGDDRSYCTEEFVDELPAPETDNICATLGCQREETLAPVVDGGATITLCRACRKDYWGVST